MGADLIGFLVVGPQKFSKERKEKAHDFIRELTTAYEAGDFEHPLLVQTAEHKIDVSDRQEIEDFYECEFPLNEAHEKLDEFIDMWETHSCPRDMDMRYHGDNTIAFAGEMSWGDTPEGYGYTMLDLIMTSGLGEVLGIE